MLPGAASRGEIMPRQFTLQRAGLVARQAPANKRAADLAPIIAELRAAGITSFNGIAVALNERGIPGDPVVGITRKWRMLARLPA
jgi:hypothetical protein